MTRSLSVSFVRKMRVETTVPNQMSGGWSSVEVWIPVTHFHRHEVFPRGKMVLGLVSRFNSAGCQQELVWKGCM